MVGSAKEEWEDGDVSEENGRVFLDVGRVIWWVLSVGSERGYVVERMSKKRASSGAGIPVGESLESHSRWLICSISGFSRA